MGFVRKSGRANSSGGDSHFACLASNVRGFTLLELLVVLVIAGLALGMVSFAVIPNGQQELQNDARRIALLLQLARDEAILRNRQIAFEADTEHYRFLLREENTWQELKQDDILRERKFKHFPVTSHVDQPSSGQAVRIVFGREPVDNPFVLTLAAEDAQAVIRADGVGHFFAE